MKVILHMAVSADGFIAKIDGDSDWVSSVDNEVFEKRCKDTGCIIVGRKTFEQYRGSIYPIKGCTNIVLTNKNVSYNEPEVLIAKTPKGALAIGKGKGYDEILLVGGGQTSGIFLNEGLINEAYLTFHPLVLGSGIRLFSGAKKDVKMNLLESKNIGDGVIQNHYKII